MNRKRKGVARILCCSEQDRVDMSISSALLTSAGSTQQRRVRTLSKTDTVSMARLYAWRIVEKTNSAVRSAAPAVRVVRGPFGVPPVVFLVSVDSVGNRGTDSSKQSVLVRSVGVLAQCLVLR